MSVMTMAVVVGAAVTAWGAPTGEGTPIAATAPSAGAATAVPVEAAVKVDEAGLNSVISLRAPNKKWVKKASEKWAKSATKKKTTKRPSANKQAARSKWLKSSQVSVATKKRTTSASKSKISDCSPLKTFLVNYYTLSWTLAMFEPNAARAFRIFTAARAHAAKYVARHPKTPSTVCGQLTFQKAMQKRGNQIVRDNRDRKGKLPPTGHFRVMNPRERAAMARVLNVPLRQAVPKNMLPKRVPMLV